MPAPRTAWAVAAVKSMHSAAANGGGAAARRRVQVAERRVGMGYADPARIERLARLLRRTPLFSGLSDAEAQLVAASLRRVSVRRGTLLFSQGDQGNVMYITMSGRL